MSSRCHNNKTNWHSQHIVKLAKCDKFESSENYGSLSRSLKGPFVKSLHPFRSSSGRSLSFRRNESVVETIIEYISLHQNSLQVLAIIVFLASFESAEASEFAIYGGKSFIFEFQNVKSMKMPVFLVFIGSFASVMDSRVTTFARRLAFLRSLNCRTSFCLAKSELS